MEEMETDKPQLKNIVYISIPEEMETEIGNFTVDPRILLPIELPPGEEELYLENLSWEMIIAAMLKILAYQPDHENCAYYRSFITAAKPNLVEELTYTGIMKARQKDYTLAEEIFLALAHLEKNSVSSWINLALVYEERAEAYKKAEKDDFREYYVQKAIETYSTLFEIDPDSPEGHLNAGYFYLKVEGFQKAKQHFKAYQAFSTDKEKLEEVNLVLQKLESQEHLDILFKEAYDFIRLGNEEEGILRIKSFLKDSPQVSNAWFLLGWAFRRLGKYSEGKEAFLKALELDKPHTDVLNELAICLMELGELKESRKRLAQALRIEPENVKIISNLGILALKENNEDEAKAFFQTVLGIEPEDPIALKYLDFLSGK